MNLIALIAVVSLLFFFPITQAVKTKNWGLNHRSLHKQPIFWAAVNWPIAAALALGFPVWTSYAPRFDQSGYSFFLDISKLPLGILGAGLAITAFVASMHRSIQTAKQIEHSEHKKAEEDDERILETANNCLEKSYDLLSKHGKKKQGMLPWKNSAAFIAEFDSKKNKIRSRTMLEQLEVSEDYWRAKFEELLAINSSSDLHAIQAHPADVFFVATFSMWRKGRLDSKSYPSSQNADENMQGDDKTKKILEDFYNFHQGKIRTHQLFVAVLQPIDMPNPNDIFEDAVSGPPSDDPPVREEQERRGLIPKSST